MSASEKNAKFSKACPESAKILNQEKQGKTEFSNELRDGAYQRGCTFRAGKLSAIMKARQAGISDDQILRELRIGGLTIQKARELMKDSEELLGR
jgi:hypothetical protein